jgi:hypothetical protein
MDMAHFNGTMGVYMKENGIKIWQKELELSLILMVNGTVEIL